MQSTGCHRDSACRLRRGGGIWLVEDGVPRCAPLPSFNLVPSGRVAARERQEHCRGEPDGSALSGRYAPDSTKAEGSSIVDEPGEG